jgi:hydrogenase-4 component B
MILLWLALAGYAWGTLATLWVRGAVGRWVSAIGAMVGAGAAGLAAWQVLLTGETVRFEIASVFPFLSLSFHLDALGSFFLLLLALVAIPASLYGTSYYSDDPAHRTSRILAAMTCPFLLSMSLVLLAANVLTFLFAWELMTLTSCLLILSERDSEENLKAAHWYAGMGHAGFGLIAVSFLLLASSGTDTDFASLRVISASLSPALKNVIFLLSLVGFGSKAGLIPLHVWLPRAHPAAPSPVSALMSGAMLKIGVYGIIRLQMDLLGAGPVWWGSITLGVGALTAILGVLYALMEKDLKRLLAFHSVENLGLIFMGLGLGFVFRSNDMPTLATLALVAALYHSLNHAAFKGLLFLGAGAVGQACGTRNMEELGGLIHRMPQTAFCFLVGSAAISALPPLNGFASEWMLFQSLIAATQLPHSFLPALMALGVGVLALTGGLAAACFVKAALGRSRKGQRGSAADAPGHVHPDSVLFCSGTFPICGYTHAFTGFARFAWDGLDRSGIPCGNRAGYARARSQDLPPGFMRLPGAGAAGHPSGPATGRSQPQISTR